MKNGPELKIKLSPSLVAPTKAWIERFSEHQQIRFAKPVLKGNVLEVRPFDAVNLVTFYAKSEDANELDVRRLRSFVLQELKKALARKRSEGVRQSYLSKIAALEKPSRSNPSKVSDDDLEFVV